MKQKQNDEKIFNFSLQSDFYDVYFNLIVLFFLFNVKKTNINTNIKQNKYKHKHKYKHKTNINTKQAYKTQSKTNKQTNTNTNQKQTNINTVTRLGKCCSWIIKKCC